MSTLFNSPGSRIFTCFVFVFAFWKAFKPMRAEFAGIYFDNGMQQSEVVEYISVNEKVREDTRDAILQLLGLDNVPGDESPHYQSLLNAIHDNHTQSQFMMDLWTSLTKQEGEIVGELKPILSEPDLEKLRRNPFHITQSNIQAINESDAIMSFPNRGAHGDSLGYTRSYYFDNNHLPNSQEEDILSSELRIYKEKSEDSATESYGNFMINVFRYANGSIGDEELLDSKTLDSSYEGWLVFDITEAVKIWQKYWMRNNGLLLTVTGANKEPIRPFLVGLSPSNNASPNEEFMVTYLKSREDFIKQAARITRRESEKESKRQARRERRSPNQRKKNRKNRNKPKFSNLDNDFMFGGSGGMSSANVYRDFYGGRSRYKGCQKRVLRVSFRDLNWQDWIIAPDGYEAFYCHGECSFPLNSHMNATNHAIVQTLVHLMNPDSVPKPCCAPTKLSGISVLYFDESSNVILKKYRNMVVKSCGCH